MKRMGWQSGFGSFLRDIPPFLLGIQPLEGNMKIFSAQSMAASGDLLIFIIIAVALAIGGYITFLLVQNYRKEQKFQSITKKIPSHQAPLLVNSVDPIQYYAEAPTPAPPPIISSAPPSPSEPSANPKMNEYTEFPETEIFDEKFDFSYIDLSRIMQTITELFPALKSYIQENLLEYTMEVKTMSNKEIFALLSAALEKLSEQDLRTQLERLKSEFDSLEPVGAECSALITKVKTLFKYIESVDNRELFINLSIFLILIKSSIYKSNQ